MAAMTEREKLQALLPHWIEHNAEHAAEFRRWARVASGAEPEIEAAATQLEAANAALTIALEKLRADGSA